MFGNNCVLDQENLANNEMVCFGRFNRSGELGCSVNTKAQIENTLNPMLKKAGLYELSVYELGSEESAQPDERYKKIDSSYLLQYVNWLIENKALNSEKPKISLFIERYHGIFQ